MAAIARPWKNLSFRTSIGLSILGHNENVYYEKCKLDASILRKMQARFLLEISLSTVEQTKIQALTIHLMHGFGRWIKIIILRWTSGRFFDDGPRTTIPDFVMKKIIQRSKWPFSNFKDVSQLYMKTHYWVKLIYCGPSIIENESWKSWIQLFL